MRRHNATRVAVCLLGQERSFRLISSNIEVMLRSLRRIGPVHVFGVVTPNDGTNVVPWHNIKQMLQKRPPIGKATFEPQTTHNLTGPSRFTGGSASGFMIELWDCAHCHAMIKAHEAKAGWMFQVVARMRPDLFWEMIPTWPEDIEPNQVHVPGMSRCHGVNDKFAIGGRVAMAKYLDRVYEVPFERTPKPIASERFLLRVLNNFPPRIHADWMFCKMGYAANRTIWLKESGSAWLECSLRILEGLRCEYMVCGWCGQGCRCWNNTCSDERIMSNKRLCHDQKVWNPQARRSNWTHPPGFPVVSQLLRSDR